MQKLREWRTNSDRKLSLAEAGALVGVSGVQWNRLENGRRTISPLMARKLETVTGIPKEELLPAVYGAAA